MILQSCQLFEIHRILIWILEFKSDLLALSVTPKRRRPYCACFTFHFHPALEVQPSFLIFALSGAVAFTIFCAAIARLGQLAVRPNTSLCVHAPEEPIIASRHAGVAFGQDVQPFPTQRWAEIRMMNVQTFGFADHACSPFAARRMARLTATCAILVFYLLRPSALAFLTTAAPPAAA